MTAAALHRDCSLKKPTATAPHRDDSLKKNYRYRAAMDISDVYNVNADKIPINKII
jgi:hypothetical protein